MILNIMDDILKIHDLGNLKLSDFILLANPYGLTITNYIFDYISQLKKSRKTKQSKAVGVGVVGVDVDVADAVDVVDKVCSQYLIDCIHRIVNIILRN